MPNSAPLQRLKPQISIGFEDYDQHCADTVFNVDISSYDVIIGYRADDSYFAFAEDFLNNSISLPRLEKAMKLGKLGEQVVLKSQKAFEELEFFDSLKADSTKYFTLKIKRNEDAREMSNIKNTLNEQYILDIMRQGVKDEN